ncbi:MAG TPA: hypothetical protein VJW96_09055 [Terriglobales bacterium]|jgi:hypothetical protein|nr:hypothetical protein [Terriglobales bacterium]
MSANRPIVLILTSDPAFSREITANWPRDPTLHPNAPEFIVLDGGFSRDLEGSNYDLAIADASHDKKRRHQADEKKSMDINIDIDKNKDKNDQRHDNSAQIKALKQSLAATSKPAIMIHPNPAPDFYNADLYKIDGAVLELRREPRLWPAMAGLLGREILRRRQAESRDCEAEQTCAAAQAEATLGRYMLEMRTNINNALTTLLGNAELLALEPGLPAAVQAQADTIRNMALRLHEVFRRFSSIEKELTVVARESGKKAAHATAGRS